MDNLPYFNAADGYSLSFVPYWDIITQYSFVIRLIA